MTFLFPRLDYGIIILDFEKIAFFDSEAIFGPFAAPEKSFFTWRTLASIPLLFEKKRKNEKFFENLLENVLSYSEIYFGPPRTIWSLRNRFSKIFFFENLLNPCNPPLVTYLRDIKKTFIILFRFWSCFKLKSAETHRARWAQKQNNSQKMVTIFESKRAMIIILFGD